MTTTQIGKITHFFDKIGVAVLEVTAGTVSVGDQIRLGNEDTGFVQTVDSMQVDHAAVVTAKSGDEVGLKVTQPVKKGELVYKVEA